MTRLAPTLNSPDRLRIETGPSALADPRTTGAALGGPRIAADPERGGLLELWRVVRAKFGTVLLAMGIGLALALVVVLLKKPVYTAKCELVIESPNGDFLNTQAVSPVAEDPSSDNGLTDVETQLQVIESDQMIDRVIAKLAANGKLAPLEAEAERSSLAGRLLRRPPLSPTERSYRMHRIVMEHLTVRQAGPTRAVDISYSSTDPKFAADLCNTLASEYMAYNMESRWAMSERTGEGLSRRLDAVRAQLQESQKNLQEYAERSGLVFGPPVPGTTEQTDISENRLTELQDELSRAQADRMAAESRLNTAQSGGSSSSIAEVVNDERLRDLQSRITDLERQKADLSTVYTPQNEKVERVQAQLAPLQAAFNQHLSAIMGRIRNDYAAAARREQLLKSAYDQQVSAVTDKNNKAIQYSVLKHQVDANQKLYESMLEQVNRVSIASAAGSNNIQVFSGAHPPLRPDPRGTIVYSLAGMLLGFVAGSAWVLRRSTSEDTFHAPGQTQFQVHLRELGVIPSHFGIPIRTVTRTSLLSTGAQVHDGVELASHFQKSGVVAESIRMLLASIMFADGSGERPQVMVISSANPREGKTTVLCNLAVAMAEIQKRVLVVDGDLRKPRMHDIFGISNEHGLRDVLEHRGDEEEREPIGDLIRHTFVPGIDVLPSGPAVGDAEASLFYSSRLHDLLHDMRKKYDVILIDTPPCLYLADARVIGRLADSVILVTRAGRTTWTEARAVADNFSEDGTRIMGTVLNDFKRPASSYSYLSA